jgi:hypothetical protein
MKTSTATVITTATLTRSSDEGTPGTAVGGVFFSVRTAASRLKPLREFPGRVLAQV